MPEFESQGAVTVFYRRSQEEHSRLYSRAELERQVRAGAISPEELVQIEGAPIWQPVRVVLGERSPVPEAALPVDDVPSWSDLGSSLAHRLSHELERPTPAIIGVLLALGALGIISTRLGWWTSLPWFLLALLGSALLLRAGRWLPGLGLAAASLLIPFLLAPGPKEYPAEAGSVLVPEPPEPAATSSRVVVHPRPSVPLSSGQPAPATPLPPRVIATAPPVAASLPATTPAPVLPAATRVPILATAEPKPAETPVPPGKADPYRSGALVIVRDEHGAGSGFIAIQDGKRYLFTNNHVAAGMLRPVFSLLDGTRLTPVTVESAVGHDIMRLALKESVGESLEIATSVDQSARIEDEVVVFGNSRGGGVVTSLPGTIVGIGPDRIEVSSPFVPGNSGSPIIHVPTGKVLGMATYLTKKHEEFAAKGGSDVIRRFGYRLDSVKKWEPVNWIVFQADADRVEKISALTEDIFNFLESLQMKQPPSFTTETLRKPAEEWRATITRRQLSAADRKGATQSFLSNLRFMVRSDVKAAETNLHYSYFREKLQTERMARDALYKSFDTELGRMSGSALSPR